MTQSARLAYAKGSEKKKRKAEARKKLLRRLNATPNSRKGQSHGTLPINSKSSNGS